MIVWSLQQRSRSVTVCMEKSFIKEKAQKTLYRYNFNDKIYQEIWSEDFPHGVNTASVIAVYGGIGWQEALVTGQEHINHTGIELRWQRTPGQLAS